MPTKNRNSDNVKPLNIPARFLRIGVNVIDIETSTSLGKINDVVINPQIGKAIALKLDSGMTLFADYIRNALHSDNEKMELHIELSELYKEAFKPDSSQPKRLVWSNKPSKEEMLAKLRKESMIGINDFTDYFLESFISQVVSRPMHSPELLVADWDMVSFGVIGEKRQPEVADAINGTFSRVIMAIAPKEIAEKATKIRKENKGILEVLRDLKATKN